MNEEQFMQADKLARKIILLSRNSILVNMRFMENAISRLSYKTYQNTIGTDGMMLYYNPCYILKRYKEKQKLVSHDYFHLILHCIFRHNFVGAGIERRLWNIACDIAVEYQIKNFRMECIDNIFENEKNRVFNDLQKSVKHMTAEEIYHKFRNGISEKNLAYYEKIFITDDHSIWYNPYDNSGSDNDSNSDNDSDNNNNSDNDSDNNNNSDNDSDNNNNSDNDSNNNSDKNNSKNNSRKNNSFNSEKRKNLMQKWQELSEKIQSELENFLSKQQGYSGGEMVQSLRYLNRERYDYSEFLKKFSVMGEVMKLDMDSFDYQLYSYGLQMYGNVALIEPLEYKEVKRIREFVVAIDTSGSVSGELVQKFMTKTFNILMNTDSYFSRVAIWIIQCDVEIQDAVKITNKDEFEMYIKNMKLKGFGGTDFRPVFNFIDKLIAGKEFTNLKGMIYFTDGYGTFPKRKPQYETAFAFLRSDYEEYGSPEVPPWAIKLVLEDDDIM